MSGQQLPAPNSKNKEYYYFFLDQDGIQCTATGFFCIKGQRNTATPPWMASSALPRFLLYYVTPPGWNTEHSPWLKEYRIFLLPVTWHILQEHTYLTLVSALRSLYWATESYKALHFLNRPIFGCESVEKEAREVSSNCICLWIITEVGLKCSPIALVCRE